MLIYAYKYLNSLLYIIPTFSNKHTCWVTCRHLLLTGHMGCQRTLSSGGAGSPTHTHPVGDVGALPLCVSLQPANAHASEAAHPEFTLAHLRWVSLHGAQCYQFWVYALSDSFGCPFAYTPLCQNPRCLFCIYFSLTNSPLLTIRIFFLYLF